MSKGGNGSNGASATGPLRPMLRVATVMLRGEEGQVVKAFREEAATSPGKPLSTAGLGELGKSATFLRLVRGKVIREAMVPPNSEGTGEHPYYLDEIALTKYQRARKGKLIVTTVVVLHLAGACAATYLLQEFARPSVGGDLSWQARIGAGLTALLEPLQLDAPTLFSQLFIAGAFLYALLLALRHFGLIGRSYGQVTVGAAALSVAVAVLSATDAFGRARAGAGRGGRPDSASAVLYTLATERQAMSVLALLALAGAVVGTYYVVRSLVSIEYEGAGIQIRLPGHSVTHLPLFPQISWQNTGVILKEGERVSIEIYGWVSPGTLQHVSEQRQHMREFVRWIRNGQKPEEYHHCVRSVATWPYTSPAGYPEEWYDPDRMLSVLRNHPLYQQPYYFRRDDGLTVKGLPHNVVLGMIVAPGEHAPLKSKPSVPAYDYGRPEDRDKLIYLSSHHYPITFDASRSGELWIVVNDVDEARWDNGGMFFMKVTRHAWL